MFHRLFILLFLVSPAGVFAQSAADREARLNSGLNAYQRNYKELQNPDLKDVGTPRFTQRLDDLKKIEVNLDGLIKQELDELADTQLNFAKSVKSSDPSVTAAAKKIEDLHAAYVASRVEYGGNKDFKRYAAFTDLFFGSQDLFKLATPPEKTAPFNQFKQVVKKFGRLMKLSLKLAVPSLQMLLSAFQSITKTKVGFGESVDRFFGKWGEASGLSVEVTNREVLANQERLRIFVPTHRDANLDAVAFAALKVDNPVVFGALNLKNHPIFGLKDNPLVRPMITALENNDTFILAGASEKPLDKFLRLIKEGKVQNVLNYAEGQVGLGIKESRPVRAGFSEALLKALVDQGIDFDLVPVTYVNGAQYFEYHNAIDMIKVEPGQEKLLVNVQKPIRSEEIRQFFNHYPEKDFNTYLRMNWLFDLPTNEDLVLGQG